LLDGGADNEVPNTAYVSDLTVKNVQAFSMVGGSLGAGNLTQPAVRIAGGGAIKFSGTNFVLNSGAASAVKIVSNPSQPVVFDNTIQQGATNVPWCDVAGQCAALNNSISNTANLAWAITRSGRGVFA